MLSINILTPEENSEQKTLWDFVPGDPKYLGYLFTGLQMVSVKPGNELVAKAKVFSLSKIHDTDKPYEEFYEEPEALITDIDSLLAISDQTYQEVIEENLNPALIKASLARDMLMGLKKYLEYLRDLQVKAVIVWA